MRSELHVESLESGKNKKEERRGDLWRMAVAKARVGEMGLRFTWINRQDEWKKGCCWEGDI